MKLKELDTYIKIFIEAIAELEKDQKGGPGSGCRGDNCGRPESSSSGDSSSGDSSSGDSSSGDSSSGDSNMGGGINKEWHASLEEFKPKEAQIKAYKEYSAAIKPIEDKIARARNSGKEPNLSLEEKKTLNDSLNELVKIRNDFYKSHDFTPGQISIMKNIVQDWSGSIDGTKSLVFRSVLAELSGTDFGNEFVKGKQITSQKLSAIKAARSQLEKQAGNPSVFKELVLAEIAFNKATFETDYPNGKKVFRGLATKDKVSSGSKKTVSIGVASSWSTEKSVAKEFADNTGSRSTSVVLSKTIFGKDVVMYAKSNATMLRNYGLQEQEVIVLSKNNKVSNVSVQATYHKDGSDGLIKDNSGEFSEFIRSKKVTYFD